MAKPDFTGIWKFNRSRSSLQIPEPDSTTFVIEHREPRFRLCRTHVVGGNSDTFSIELTADGEQVVCNHGGLEIQARLRWERDTLVFDSELAREGTRATNVVRYRLGDAGQTLVAEESLRSAQHSHENTWVCDRE
jgi:hypothetical protein